MNYINGIQTLAISIERFLSLWGKGVEWELGLYVKILTGYDEIPTGLRPWFFACF
jgi:hypothetical protein